MSVDATVGLKAVLLAGAIVVGLVVYAWVALRKHRRYSRETRIQNERMAVSLVLAVRRENELLDQHEAEVETLAHAS